ncbi:gem (nuclear organelle) associated protein 2 [Linnemannia schmuckeri]|uniref:Gem (Nuclear organelle) associated protein 2 n=1 Tax=Linnemannia schmuckeri TaxID=64567 RepID=A0A9P5VEY6_9FUNG|nr:gem (nuclear organelle) associated protein 2 [Linnemannia schmuckeri]
MLPSSGEEYLRMVKAQARKCPAVVVASGAGAQKHLAAKNTSRKYRTDWQSCLPAPEGCTPTPEWKDQFMKDFNAARARLKQYKLSQERQTKRGGGGGGGGGSGGGAKSRQDKSYEQEASENDEQPYNIPELDSPQPPSSSTHSKPAAATARAVVLPKMHDDQKWRTLLYGSPPSSTIPASHVASTTTIVATETVALSTPSSITSATTTSKATTTTASTVPAPIPTGAIRQEGMSPSPQFLIRLDQGHLIQLLKYHLRWLAEDDLQEQEEKWLYAMFLKLDVLVESDQVAVLRNIAKKCARIRSHFHSDSGSKLATVNMVITIVARLFGQEDLE